jgi:hypothetical protein
MSARSSAAALVALSAVLVNGSVPAPAEDGTAPKPFGLILEGRLPDEGRFVASGAFCPSGRASTFGAGRLLTCADGSGRATALVDSIDSDGGVGAWRIVAGTGAHARLRGRGTFRSIRVAGPPENGPRTFRSTWIGVADRDDTPPAVAFESTDVTRLVRPRRGYLLRLVCALHDGPGNVVRYRVSVSANGRFLASRVGVTRAGVVTVVLRLRTAGDAQTLRIAIRAADPFGNERVRLREVRLPS